jgi:hypothetical protein
MKKNVSVEIIIFVSQNATRKQLPYQSYLFVAKLPKIEAIKTMWY